MVDFAPSGSSQSGVDARIEPQDSVVQSVLEAVRAASIEEVTSADPSEDRPGDAMAPPLYDFVNPDALEALFAHAQDHQGTAEWRTTFRYAGNDVSVTSAGTVTVEPDHDDDDDQRAHGCPSCDDGTVSVSDDRFVTGATLQCPECGHEWGVSF